MRQICALALLVAACSGGTPAPAQPFDPRPLLQQAAKDAQTCGKAGGCLRVCDCPALPACTAALFPDTQFDTAWQDCTGDDDQLLQGFAQCVQACQSSCDAMWLSPLSAACQNALSGTL